MRIRTIRHYVLMFAVGLSWGLMVKTFASTYLYVGYDDPQVVDSADVYPIERLVDEGGDDSEDGESFDEVIDLEEALDESNVDLGPEGTVSI